MGIALLLLLTATASAAAAQRYASPTGTSSNPCTSAAPCDLVTAVNGKSGNMPTFGDEVIVPSGNYGSAGTPLSATLQPPVNENIHGPASGARPVLELGSHELELNSGASTVSDLDLHATNTALFISNATVTRVAVSSPAYPCLTTFGAVLTDSSCITTGAGRTADLLSGSCSTPNSITLDNDDFLAPASGSSAASFTTAGSGCALTVTGSNDIFRSGTGGTDVSAETNTAGASVVVTLDHSDFTTRAQSPHAGTTATVTAPGSGTNITADPLLTDPAAGDFHETGGSPTIDAGATAAGNGSEDVDSQPRTEGGKTDIGADEFIAAPVPGAVAPSGLTSTSVTLNGTISPGHDTTTPTIAYGTTPFLGSEVSGLSPIAASLTARPVSAGLSGLSPGTTYYWKLSASNHAGSASTPLQSFTTPALPKAVVPIDHPAPVPLVPQVSAAKFGNQQITFVTPSLLTCTKAPRTLSVSLNSTAIPKSRATKLKFSSAAAYIGRGVKHTTRKTEHLAHHRTKRVTVTSYTANATIHHVAATVALRLTGLKTSTQTLKVVVSYKETVTSHRHRTTKAVTKTLTSKFKICL
jgi:hypothetical protein